MLDTPVTFLIYNRPELTERVFAVIAQARPKTLLVVADGPRPDRADDADKCKRARAIIDRIDWPCDVRMNLATTNLGCRRRVSSGLDWVFRQTEESIILEDDCLPDPSFFRFCENLLSRYHDDARVMLIAGYNFQPSAWTCASSYYFSRYAPIWGWATWRRAWKLYDVNMEGWPALRTRGWLSTLFSNPREVQFWNDAFDRVHIRGYDTWDYQWTFACFANKGLAATPAVNLIQNLGFGEGATHTTARSWLADRAAASISSIQHPSEVEPSVAEDDFVFNEILSGGHNARDLCLRSRARRVLTERLRRLGFVQRISCKA